MVRRVQRVLVIVAHPDDAESWAGGTIAKLVRDGARVAYCVVTNGDKGSGDRSVTPERLARRFDTRFFLARRPASQPVLPQPGEVEDYLWVTPARALSGELALVHATRRILESVSSEPDAARLMARLRRRRHETPPIRPRLVDLPNGGFQIVEPDA